MTERFLIARSTQKCCGRPHASALLTRRGRSRSEVEVLELVQDAARVVLQRAESLGDGHARVLEDVLDRLADALGESR
jgi:hypothetical protein